MDTTRNHGNEGCGDVGQGNKPKSMVEQHRAKLLLAKQEIAMSKMNVLLPGVREGLLREALEASNWSVETSLQLLEGFLTARAAELASLDGKIRARQAYVLEKAGIVLPDILDGKGRGTKEDRGHSRRKKRRKHTRHRSRSRSRREKRESRYGKYGVIKETDMEEKRTEFALWAMDEKKVDVEGLSQRREKELFSEFVEDFNTATLPHRKYYNLDAYQREKARRRRDRHDVGEEEHRMFDDEAERHKEREQQRQVEQSRRFREIYEELQRGGDKAHDMREQELLRQKRALAYRTGDIEQAERIAQRLRPDP